ncbi:MAG: hypothetical protein JKY33_02330 [Bacteroidia bacterium]|nr:hypothetical protein [Bacteroidia bacterium]
MFNQLLIKNEQPMLKSSTQENLIKFIYNETTTAETQSIFSKIEKDEEIFEEYEQLVRLKNSLDKLFVQPSKTSLEIILEKSRELSVAPVC